MCQKWSSQASKKVKQCYNVTGNNQAKLQNKLYNVTICQKWSGQASNEVKQCYNVL